MSWSREESPDRLGTLWSLNRFLGMEAVIVQGVSFNRVENEFGLCHVRLAECYFSIHLSSLWGRTRCPC